MNAKEKMTEILNQAGNKINNPEKLAEFLLDNNIILSPVETAQQWTDDINNPLEPIKIAAALQSEYTKLAVRKQTNQKISILDYTIIACLQKQLKQSEQEQKK